MVFLICSFLVLSLFLPFIRGVTEAELGTGTEEEQAVGGHDQGI
jgi:hypothetical protein